jgi:hypothetical protein
MFGRIMSFSLRMGVIAVCSAMLFAASANATPIDYIFTGIGSGSVGTTSFTDSTFTFTFMFDTVNVPGLTGGETEITGIGGTFTEGSFTETLKADNFVIDNTDPATPRVGFFNSTVSDGIVIQNPAFETYFLKTPLGPITETTGPDLLGDFGGGSFDTVSGPAISITDATSLTFQATITPEPASASVIVVGLALLAFVAISRRRRSGMPVRG